MAAMRDYFNGNNIPIAKMSTADIHETLRCGVEITADATVEGVIERLRLELFIRERNLRAGL